MIRAGHARPVFVLAALAGAAIAVLCGPVAAGAKVVKLQTVEVGEPGNPSVAIVPFSDAIYESCADAPAGSSDCIEVGGVDYAYAIGQIEVTVKQWVGFLNTVDPRGRDRHDLYSPSEASAGWPRFGAIDKAERAPRGRYYSVASGGWADKPYGFADFPRAARFVNSLYNGRVRSKTTRRGAGLVRTDYSVRLSRHTQRGMYDLARDRGKGATRKRSKGFVVPSQDEWIKAAYFDPAGGGTLSYWKYPTNAGVFGDDTATAPAQSTLDPASGDVTNSGTQPLATYHDLDLAPPSWCPAEFSAEQCSSANPFGLDPTTYAKIYQGSVGTVASAKTRSPWGTLDQGGNVVEWTDTITPPPAGTTGPRIWRRLHGGIANAPAYQLWLSAVGLQPENNRFYEETYPWLGFRVGVIGEVASDR